MDFNTLQDMAALQELRVLEYVYDKVGAGQAHWSKGLI